LLVYGRDFEGPAVDGPIYAGRCGMRIHPGYWAVAALAVVLAAYVSTQARAEPPAKDEHGFQGYWMGVDPTDGGDARRSLMKLDNGKFALAARDSVLTLCGGTDRGFASFDDGELVDRNELRSDTLTIQCFNNGASVVLHVRYELVEVDLMLERTTLEDGTLFSTIVFHRVSQD
jgi:hypothetical protein